VLAFAPPRVLRGGPSDDEQLLPILIMLFIAVGFAAVSSRSTGSSAGISGILEAGAYESGVPLIDSNRKRMNVRFYQIAMLFIVFDIEAAFLYPGRSSTATPR